MYGTIFVVIIIVIINNISGSIVIDLQKLADINTINSGVFIFLNKDLLL